MVEINIFNRWTDALNNGTGLELTHAEVEFLQSLIGDALTEAENEYIEWQDRFAEYERFSAREG